MSPNSSGGQSPYWRDCAWQVIKDTPNLIYLILTKRPELIPARLPKDWGEGYPNVWLGPSVGCKQRLPNIDLLREVPIHPKAVRFLSCEPLLENIDWDINLEGIGWVICGGESGTNPEYRWNPEGDWRKELQDDRGRRTMEIGWAKDLRMKCEAAGILFWFKQVTAGRAGTGEDALGEVVHEVPPPPYGEWVSAEESEPKLQVLDEEFIEAYLKRNPGVHSTRLIGQYSRIAPKAEPPVPIGSYYMYKEVRAPWSAPTPTPAR